MGSYCHVALFPRGAVSTWRWCHVGEKGWCHVGEKGWCHVGEKGWCHVGEKGWCHVAKPETSSQNLDVAHPRT